MELEIRQADANEVALVSEVLTEAADWLRERGEPLWAAHEISSARITPDVQGGFFFLAWSGLSAVGTMRLTPSDPVFWPEAKRGEALYLHRLAVRRAAAGGAVSASLLRWAATEAFVRGTRYLRLDCEASRFGLRRVYERFGFSFHSELSVGQLRAARYQLLCERRT